MLDETRSDTDNLVYPCDADGKRWTKKDEYFVHDGQLYNLDYVKYNFKHDTWYLVDTFTCFTELADKCYHCTTPRSIKDIVAELVNSSTHIITASQEEVRVDGRLLNELSMAVNYYYGKTHE